MVDTMLIKILSKKYGISKEQICFIVTDADGEEVWTGHGSSSVYEEQVEDGTVYVADGYRCRKCGATK